MSISGISYVVAILCNIISVEVVINLIKYWSQRNKGVNIFFPVVFLAVLYLIDLISNNLLFRVGILVILLTAITSMILYYYRYFVRILFDYFLSIYGIYTLFIIIQNSMDTDHIVLRIDLILGWLFVGILYGFLRLYHKISRRGQEGSESDFLSIFGIVSDVSIYAILFFLQRYWVERKTLSIALFEYNASTITNHLLMTGMMVWAVVYFFAVYEAESVRMNRNQLSELAYARSQSEVEKIEQMYHEARKIRHNYKNSVMGIKQMLAEKKYKQIDGYLGELLDTIDGSEGYVRYCNNSIVNYLLNDKAKTCRNQGIEFKCMIGGEFKDISNVDLSILLGNLLDNAIEAAAEVAQRTSDSYVSIQIYCALKTKILIENSIESKANERVFHLKTTKADEKNHGFGVTSISEIVHKYHGDIVYERMDGVMLSTICF